MTKKDYIIIAKCINMVYKPLFEQFNKKLNHEEETHEAGFKIWVIHQIIGNMFDEFAKDNPKFDWQKFKKDCYK